MKQVAVIFPVFNKQNSIPKVYTLVKRRIEDDLQISNYELTFVDDGSTDKSLHILEALQIQDPEHVRVFKHAQRLGQVAALKTGIDQTDAHVTFMASCDLQNSFEVIPNLYKAVAEQGYEIAIGYRKKTAQKGVYKIISRLFFRLTRFFFKKMPVGGFDYGCFGEKLRVHYQHISFDKVVVQLEALRVCDRIYYEPIERQDDLLDHSGWKLREKLVYATQFYRYLTHKQKLLIATVLIGIPIILSSVIVWLLLV